MLYWYQAKVIRVIDGDTLELEIDLGLGVFKRERVRLWGINAPELNTEAGFKAREALDDLLNDELGDYEQIMVRTIKDRRDKYGRYLAIAYDWFDTVTEDRSVEFAEAIKHKRLPPDSINSKMVSNGHAVERYY